MPTLSLGTLTETFQTILLREGFAEDDAASLAKVFMKNTRDGVLSHGAGRFTRFVKMVRDGAIDPAAKPECTGALGALEQWDGRMGPGPLNALAMTDRAMALADAHGVGLVALSNTTHWMRGATYGYHAAGRGYPLICWTNTLPNMSPWGSTARVLGNNPMVFALPGRGHPMVLDMALSQYSYGRLETAKLTGEMLPYPGGFDVDGNLTCDPGEILRAKQVLPIGLWKGAGLSLAVDLFAALLSGGTPAALMPKSGHAVSQVFLAVHPGATDDEKARRLDALEEALHAMKTACSAKGETFAYPGLGTSRRRMESEVHGVHVPDAVWEDILSL